MSHAARRQVSRELDRVKYRTARPSAAYSATRVDTIAHTTYLNRLPPKARNGLVRNLRQQHWNTDQDHRGSRSQNILEFGSH